MEIEKYTVRRLLVRAEKSRKNAMQPYFASLGLAFGQGHARILDSLLTADCVTQRELADACHLDAATISRSLDRLQELGYIRRERDPDCRRSFLICMTPEGKRTAEKIRGLFHQVDQQIWEGIDEETMAAFCRCLELICSNLEHMELPQ